MSKVIVNKTLTQDPEKYQPLPGRLPRHDDDLHCSKYHLSFRRLRSRLRYFPHESFIPHQYSNPHFGVFATFLETNLESLWPTTNLADVHILLHDLQYWLR